jgi:hypothetical protein
MSEHRPSHSIAAPGRGRDGETETMRRGAGMRRLASLAPLLLAATVMLAFYVIDVRRADPPVTGDEPHYLAVADAMVHGTLDVRAAYRDPSGVRKWVGVLPTDQTVVHAGHLRSMRLPLLPLILAPAMALDSLVLLRLTMVLVAVLVLDQLWRLLSDLGYRGAARAAPWVATLTALPVLGYATHLYPEMPGALCVVVALRLVVRGTRRALVVASGVVGLLPWLIVRFDLLALALLVVVVVAAVRPERMQVGSVADAFRRRGRDAFAVAAPFLVSMLAFFAYLFALYGTFDVRATYPPGFTQAWTPWHAYVEGIGSLFGAGEGFAPYAPAFLIGLVAVVVAARRYRALGWFLLAAAAVHLLVVVPTGFWGSALPGRFVIVLVPFLAIAIAEALRTVPVLRAVVVGLVAVQIGIVFLYHDVNVLILDRVPHYSYLAAFPPVDDEPGLSDFALGMTRTPGSIAYVAAGTLHADRDAGSGLVYGSPKLTLRPGRFRLECRLAAAGPPSTVEIARLTVTELPANRVLAHRSIHRNDLGRPIELEFSAPGQPVRWTKRVVVTVQTTGVEDLELRSVVNRPVARLPPRDHVVHDGVPLGAAWIAAVAVGAALLASKHRTGRRARPRRAADGSPMRGVELESMSDQQWYWCLERGVAVTEDDPCPPDRRLGPYPTRAAAENWKQTVEARNEAWDADDKEAGDD